MISSKLTNAILLLSLLSVLQANAQQEQLTCDDSYNNCIQKCDETDNPTDSCYSTCDDTYMKCLESEQNLDSKEES